MYKHDHPDSEIFKQGSEWKSVQTLGDYINKKHPYPCVVVGGELRKEKENGTKRPD